MKEYAVDLIIDRTFHVFAESREAAKVEAIAAARAILGSYNSLYVDQIESMDDEEEPNECDFENEYNAYCYDINDKMVYCYGIEADDEAGAYMAAKEFFTDDYPDRELKNIQIAWVRKVCD